MRRAVRLLAAAVALATLSGCGSTSLAPPANTDSCGGSGCALAYDTSTPTAAPYVTAVTTDSAPSTTNPVVEEAPATSPAPAPEAPISNTWTYKVAGPHKALITFSQGGGNTSQSNGAALPWSKTVDNPGVGGMSFAYVSAQNSGGGTIACQIIDPSGSVVAENSSEGDYAIVTCQG